MSEAMSGLDAYFERISDGALAGRWANEVNLLSQPQVDELSHLFASHPIVSRLGGLVLDDPETSNHHVLLTKGPCAGQVLYLSHDDDSRVVFDSLNELVDAASRTVECGAFLFELHPQCSPVSPNQAELAQLIEEGLRDGADDCVAMALIPSLELNDMTLLQRIAASSNFFATEAIANEVSKRPEARLLPIATLCSKHRHPQAAAAGKAAMAAIAAHGSS